jgi:hypothetical protein
VTHRLDSRFIDILGDPGLAETLKRLTRFHKKLILFLP